MATFVTENGDTSGSGASGAAISLTPSGSNRVLYVTCVHFGSTSDVTGVTFNTTQNLTQLKAGDWFTAGSGGRVSVWRLIAPAAVTANVAVTFPAGVTESSVCCVVYSGVDQSTPERTIASLFDTSGSQTTNATSVSGDTVLGAAGYDASGSAFASSTGTIRSSHLTASHDGAVMLDQIAAGSSTGVNFNTTNHGDIAFALINAAVVAAGPTPPLPRAFQEQGRIYSGEQTGFQPLAFQIPDPGRAFQEGTRFGEQKAFQDQAFQVPDPSAAFQPEAFDDLSAFQMSVLAFQELTGYQGDAFQEAYRQAATVEIERALQVFLQAVNRSSVW